MANEYYDSTGYPQTGASGSSASMRAELDSVEAGFNKLPTLTANGNKLVKVNSAGTGLETTSVISDDGTNATVTGDLTIAGGNVGVDADSMHAIPNVAADTLTLNAAAQTLTNKTLFAANNTITTAASGNLEATELNAALAELQSDVDTREKSINAAAAKATPVDADTMGLIDSAAASVLKKVTWANIKATLKAYFDTIYISVGNFAASGANSDITSLSALSTPLSVAQGGTGSATNAGTAYALKGANSDITSLAGLTTPLSVAQGGTGANTNAGTAYALKGANSDITSLSAITNITATAVTVAADDKVVIQDTSDSDKIKTVTAQAIADLASVPDAITLGTPIATTSGTNHDFGSLPAGIKQFTISVSGISFTSTVALGFRLGTGGTPQATGYTSNFGTIAVAANTTTGGSTTAGFLTSALGAAGQTFDGDITFTLLDASTNTWSAKGMFVSNVVIMVTGNVSLSGTLDIVRLYGGTFDAGKANIAYSL